MYFSNFEKKTYKYVKTGKTSGNTLEGLFWYGEIMIGIENHLLGQLYTISITVRPYGHGKKHLEFLRLILKFNIFWKCTQKHKGHD